MLPLPGSNNKKDYNHYDSSPYKTQKKNFLALSSSQVNVKVVGLKKKKTTRHMSENEEKNSISGERFVPKDSGRFLYKRSTLQTEGNFTHLKKKGMHVKLSSLSSDVKDPSFDGGSMTMDANADGKNFETLNGQQNEGVFLRIGQNEYSDLFEGGGRTKAIKNPTKALRKLKN